jgi:hypothetical protein
MKKNRRNGQEDVAKGGLEIGSVKCKVLGRWSGIGCKFNFKSKELFTLDSILLEHKVIIYGTKIRKNRERFRTML